MDAFETVMLPHLDAAHGLARWLLRDPHEAEDAVQDAYLRAYRAFGRFRGSNGKGWLLTIVRNVCYSKLREKRRVPDAMPFEDEVHGSVAHVGESNAVAWRELNSQILQQALEGIAPEYREMIVLHEIEGLAYRDIADVAEIPIGTVMSRLSRAREKLRSQVLELAGRGHR